MEFHFMDDDTCITGKRCAEMKEIEAQALIITENFNPEKIILFGSYNRGNPTPDSDVDLLVIMQTNKSPLKTSSEIAFILNHAFPMDILVKTPEQIAQRLQEGDFFIEDIINNGKTIYEKTHS
jgi:predicted nucleotidyltransferase